MTDYGRGPGSEPWHPEDPLFGDVYDQGYQGPSGQGHPPQHPHPQQGGWQDPYATGQHQAQYPQQGYPQQQYEQQYEQPYGQQPAQGYQQGGYDGYDTGAYQTGAFSPQDPYGGQPQDPYGGGRQPDFYGQNGYPPPQQPQFRGRPQQGMGPGPGGPGTAPGQGMDPNMNPGMNPGTGQGMGQGRPMGPGMGPGQGGMGPQGGHPGPDGLQGHPQEPATGPLRAAPASTGEWEPDEDDPRDHAFFSGGDDEDDDDAPSGGRRGGRSQGKEKGGRKRRSGCACMVVLVVLAGGIGGIGYAGYNFYESRFGPAPDYSGQGSGAVQVEIPEGSTVTTMGNILKRAGVVKSVGAFTAAAGKNPKGSYIQAGVYVLNLHMSGADAVAMMLDPKSQNTVIFAEGMRDAQIYAAIDKRLKLKPGTTKKAAHDKWRTLGLPSWANSQSHIKDPLEGFLFPSRYSISKGEKPEALLKEMVGQAKQQYAQFDLASEAKQQGLKNPLQLITVASLVQAEGKTDDDFKKMAKVVYNRMDPTNHETYGLLQFDSTYNYIKNTSQTNISLAQVKSLDDWYNTYKYKGLPPGPIGNPGIEALKAAMSPDSGNWYYFLSMDGKTTKFTETKAQFDKLYQQYNAQSH